MKLGEELNESLGSKKDRCSGISQVDDLKGPRLIACSESCTWLLMIYLKCWRNYNPVVVPLEARSSTWAVRVAGR